MVAVNVILSYLLRSQSYKVPLPFTACPFLCYSLALSSAASHITLKECFFICKAYVKGLIDNTWYLSNYQNL